MAYDRFIYWKDIKPSFEQLDTFIRDFFDIAGEVDFKDSAWVISLPGKPKNPVFNGERCIEVFKHGNSIDVITRQQDNFTTCLANGLASCIARFFEAEIGEGPH